MHSAVTCNYLAHPVQTTLGFFLSYLASFVQEKTGLMIHTKVNFMENVTFVLLCYAHRVIVLTKGYFFFKNVVLTWFNLFNCSSQVGLSSSKLQ